MTRLFRRFPIVVPGVATMTSKALVMVVTVALAAAVAWLAVTPRAIDRLLGTPTLVGSERRGASEAAESAAVAVGAGPAPAERAAVLLSAEEQAAAAALAPPPPGHVAFRVVDARSGQPFENVRVRFLHEFRFAEYAGGGDVDAVLTPGKWEANVTATGCEPALLDAFKVSAGETTALGVVALAQGCGVVEGAALARHLAGDSPVVVQLFGEGRSPCELCRPRPDVPTPESCPCGYRPDHDEFELKGDRRFRFVNLAAGVYWLRAFEPAQRITKALRIELLRGGRCWNEVDLSTPTSARFELRHDASARGGLFTGDWEGVHREKAAPIRFSFKRDGRAVGEVCFGPAQDDVRSTMGAPILPYVDGAAATEVELSNVVTWARTLQLEFTNVLISRTMVIDSFGNVIFNASSGADSRLDRDRQEGDALDFDGAEPEENGAELKIEPLRPDLFEIGRLPRSLLTVVVSCGHYVSGEVPVDLRFERFAPIVVTMAPTQEWLAQLATIVQNPAASCATCHGNDVSVRFLDADQDGRILISLGNGVFTETNGRGVEILDARDGAAAPGSDGN